MGMRVLENEQLKVMIADAGAELSSVYDKENRLERLWDGNPEVWNRHAPILFPFVGKVIDGKYRIGEKEYEMKTQHGFARDMEFECIEESPTAVTHRLLPTEKTRQIYPYEYELLVTHALDGENPRVLHVKWEVRNHSDNVMYYAIGGHPAFTIPEKESKARENYYIGFPGRDELTYISVNPVNGFVVPEKEYELKLDNGLVKFFGGLYDTLIFDYQKIEKVCIVRPDRTPYVTMDCRELPLLGIWAKETGNFICLEPWAGRSDNDGFAGTIDEKVAEQRLDGGCSAKIAHSIEFHK